MNSSIPSLFNSTSWKKHLLGELNEDYINHISNFLINEKLLGNRVFPAQDFIFKAFDSCSFEDLKVVILGQDPYHGANQADGLAFSVPKGFKLPPSLRNILKEIASDLNHEAQVKDDLSSWANQGVLLLNSILTVREGEPASHHKIGWEKFTDAVVNVINEQKKAVVFILWGNYAIRKGEIINREKHLVLTAAHPSPLSAYQGFFGCKHFSKANEYLSKQNQTPIKW